MTSLSTTIPLEVHDLCVTYDLKPVIWGVDFSLPTAQTLAIVGPNGAGKSTLLKAIMGLVPIAAGWIKIFGQSHLEKKSLIAYVPQREQVDWEFPISVLEVVLMGRAGSMPFYGRASRKDRDIALHCLSQVGLADFARRQINQLSGGQQQRVFIARALAQEAVIYLMDEPFAGVDVATEETILKIFSALKAEAKAIICVHHDLHTVKNFFDLTLMINLSQVAYGATEEVLTTENLSKTYGARLAILSDASRHVQVSPTK